MIKPEEKRRVPRKYDLLPEHMQDGAILYLERGVMGGDFMTKVFENDLVHAFYYADDTNRACMFNWASFLYNEVPTAAWGSPKKVREWHKRGGLLGPTDGDYQCKDCRKFFNVKGVEGGCPYCESPAIVRKNTVTCKQCHKQEKGFHDALAQSGWQFFSKGDLCPMCIEENAKRHKPESRLGEGTRGDSYGT